MHSATKIKDKLGERMNHLREAQRVTGDANTEERVLTPEEQQTVDNAWREGETIDEVVRQWEDENRIEREIADSQAHADSINIDDPDAGDAFDHELRAGLLNKSFNRTFSFKRHAIERRMVEQRNVTTGSGSGGALVPEDFVARVYETRRDYSALLNCMPEVITSQDGAPMPYPFVSTVAAAAAVTEAAAISTSTGQPVFDAFTLNSYKFASLIPVSFELLRDEGVNLTAFLAGHMGRALAYRTDQQFINGDGSSKPLGPFSTATGDNDGVNAGVTVTTAGTMTWKEVKALQYSVPGGYVRSAAASDMLPPNGTPCWLMRRVLLGAIFSLADTSNYPIFRARISESEPDMLDGYRVNTSDQVPFGTATGAGICAFGNFDDCMVVREINSVRFDTDPSVYFAQDMVAFRAIVEADSKIKDRNAVKTAINP